MEVQVAYKFVLCLQMSNLLSWIHELVFTVPTSPTYVTINTVLWKLNKYYEQKTTLTAIVSGVLFFNICKEISYCLYC